MNKSSNIINFNTSIVKEVDVPVTSRFFKIDDTFNVISRTCAKGNQEKYYNVGESIFIEACFEYDNKIWRDDKVEFIASDICSNLGIKAVKQHKSTIEKGNNSIKGSYSQSFLCEDETFITFSKMLNTVFGSDKNIDSAMDKYRISATDRLNFDLDVYENFIDREYAKKYLLNMCLIDILVLNEDRHLNNYGMILNTKTNKYNTPSLFDFGLGLFEHDHIYENNSLQTALDKVKLKNYLVNPLKLLKWLVSLDDEAVMIKLSKFTTLDINYDYPNTLAKQYMHFIQKEVQQYV